MDWLDKWNSALAYVEENLKGEVDYQTMAKIACCSSYHMQRIFSYMAGLPLSEYIRKRKMTAAAFDLQNEDIRILDLALRYGYESPTAFTRAFQSIHGVNPSTAKEEGTVLQAYPPISFTVSIKGEKKMHYKIVKKDAFRVVGKKIQVSTADESGMAEIQKFWGQCAQDGSIPTILSLMNKEPMGLMGLSVGDWSKSTLFDYYIAVSSDKNPLKGTDALEVPPCTWAIFECIGPMPDAIQDMSRRIMTEWLPTSGYEYAEAPDIEMYSEGDNTAADYRCEIWLPVVKKS